MDMILFKNSLIVFGISFRLIGDITIPQCYYQNK